MASSSQTTTSAFTAPIAHRTSELAIIGEALMALSAEFADLPRPYIPLFSSGARFGLQLSHPSHFEAWREALGLPTSSVDLVTFDASIWLETSGSFRGVEFELTGHGVPLSQEQAVAQQVAAESVAVAA